MYSPMKSTGFFFQMPTVPVSLPAIFSHLLSYEIEVVQEWNTLKNQTIPPSWPPPPSLTFLLMLQEYAGKEDSDI